MSLKTHTYKNDIGDYFFSVPIKGTFNSFVTVCDGKHIGNFKSPLGAKKAINKARGFATKNWKLTLD